MIEGNDIICFSNDWDADPLSKKHIMQRLAAHNRVLWVNSFGMRNPTASVSDFKRILAQKFSVFDTYVPAISAGIIAHFPDLPT